MARKVRCQICQKWLTNDTAYKVRVSNRNLYYCSEEEYNDYKNDMNVRKEMLGYIAKDILNYSEFQLLPKELIKRIANLNKHYSHKIILKTFKQQEDSLKYWMNLDNKFSNEYQKINYMMAIISNNINDVFELHKTKERLNEKEEKQKIESIDIGVMNNISKKKRKVTDISEFLN